MPPIRQFPDAVLRERSATVSSIDAGVRRLIRNLLSELERQPDGVGLAAPQLGVLLRVFVFDAGEGPRALVNPRIEESAETAERLEGCLSIPGVSYPVRRPAAVRISGLDPEGTLLHLELDGLAARVVQHETDHLDGILFVDRLEPPLRAEALRLLRERVLAGVA